MDKEQSGQIKTIVEGIAERVTKEVTGRIILRLLFGLEHECTGNSCKPCKYITKLIEQPFGCEKDKK
jgi:hypothetical protein